MEKKLTEQSSSSVITDVKRNHSIHSEYYAPATEGAGSRGKGDDDLTLDRLRGEEIDPDLTKTLADRDEATRLAKEAERIANGGKASDDKGNEDETPEQKIAREEAERLAEEAKNNIKLDADGNQVDETGKIIKTKEVLAEEAKAAEENEEVELPLVDEILATTGIEILDENGKPKIYEDSVEGIIQATNDIVAHKLKLSQNQLFQDYPDVKKYLDAKLKGQTDEDFFANKLNDWKQVTINETDESQQLDIVIKGFEAKGYDKARAIKMATLIKDSGKDTLLQESKDVLKDLQTNQATAEAQAIEKANNAKIEREKKANEYWNTVDSTIKAGKLGDYVIPEVDRKAFNDYVSLAVDDNGNSAAMIARAKLTLEQKLLNDYYLFKGMNFNDLAKNAVNKQKVDTLRKRIEKQSIAGARNLDHKTIDKGADLNDISLETIDRT